MSEVLFSICLDSDTSKIYSLFNQPIILDQNKYKYYFKLLSVSFSNVFSNVNEDLEVDGTVFATPGIYDITTLIDAYNQNLSNKGKIGLNTNTGKLWIKNDTANNITITSSNFLQSNLGGNFVLPATLIPDQVINSTTVPIIQTFNYFILTSETIHNNSYLNRTRNVLSLTNLLYSFSSAMTPFKYKTFVSVEPIEFEITADMLNIMDFELRTGNNESLVGKEIGNVDFNVHGQIIRIER